MFTRVLMLEIKPGTVDKLRHDAEETFVPQVRAVPGFVAYKVAQIGDRLLIATGEFETQEGAEQMERLGAKWRSSREVITSARAYIGEVILEASSAPQERQPTRPVGQPVETTGAGMQPH